MTVNLDAELPGAASERGSGLNLEFSPASPRQSDRLEEITSFGSNPGNLRMLALIPSRDDAAPIPLVVVLHGCRQSAADYALHSGWIELADLWGFALLLPEQRPENNAHGCFNWFRPEDVQHDSGELLSIWQMIDHVTGIHPIDPKRVFATGLSAGGAMAVALLAGYPDLFAAGAAIGGLPLGSARNVIEALGSMYRGRSRSGPEWAARVRDAAPGHTGPWPRITIWHGDQDATVAPRNATELVKQWTTIHEVKKPPTVEQLPAAQHHCYMNDDGDVVVDFYALTKLGHADPINPPEGSDDGDHDEARGGMPGPYVAPAGIWAAYCNARAWGLDQPADAESAAVVAATVVAEPVMLRPLIPSVPIFPIWAIVTVRPAARARRPAPVATPGAPKPPRATAGDTMPAAPTMTPPADVAPAPIASDHGQYGVLGALKRRLRRYLSRLW
ncbi:MAG: PHB depolymerase family esterase [Azospirillaceae bacterium]|nr:PHB depolymerase family esterase [Azospirillaceae bacterium]